MTAIAVQITSILPPDTTVITWQQVPKEEQERLSRAIRGKSPEIIVYPANTAALASLVRFANENRLSLLILPIKPKFSLAKLEGIQLYCQRIITKLRHVRSVKAAMCFTKIC